MNAHDHMSFARSESAALEYCRKVAEACRTMAAGNTKKADRLFGQQIYEDRELRRSITALLGPNSRGVAKTLLPQGQTVSAIPREPNTDASPETSGEDASRNVDGGASQVLPQGPKCNASPSAPHCDEEGLGTAAKNGHFSFAPSSQPNRTDEGHIDYARNGHARSAPSVRPEAIPILVREHTRQKPIPTEPKRTGADMASAHAYRNSVFMQQIVIDGVALADWTIKDAKRVGKRKTYEGRLLLSCVEHIRSTSRTVSDNTTLQEVLSDADAKRIAKEIEKAEAARN